MVLVQCYNNKEVGIKTITYNKCAPKTLELSADLFGALLKP